MSTPQTPLVYLRYSDVETALGQSLVHYGYGQGDPKLPLPRIKPGPTDGQALKTTPQSVVFLTVGGGPGLTNEATFDRTFVSVRIVGPQHDYEAGQRLAFAVDRALLAYGGSEILGATYVLGVNRSGGPPTLLLRDNAERYHFTASYIIEAETGI